MAAAFQVRLLLGVVEQLAVEDDGDAAILVEDRLPAVGQADDAEAARGEGQAGPFQEAVLVGAAVDDGVGHRPDAPRPATGRRLPDRSIIPAMPHIRSFLGNSGESRCERSDVCGRRIPSVAELTAWSG